MGTINPILKQKVQSLSDYSGEPLETVEITELADVINDTESDIEERILASKVMVNVCENRLLRATRQVAHFKNIYMALVHENEQEKNKNSLIKQVTEKLGSTNGLEDLLERLLGKVRNK